MSITRFAALTLAATMLLAGCGQTAMTVPGATQTAKSMKARSTADADFMTAAKKAIDLMAKNKEYAKPRLVSIHGVGLDASGKLVPLLGASWNFKFWVAGQQGDYMVEVFQNVEGDIEVEESNEVRKTDIVRPLDPSKLVPPTQLVPMAIKLGLKVSRQGATYNYYDIAYNANYADPSSTETDVADVTSYYRKEQIDGLHLPAAIGFFPGTGGAAPAPAPSAAPAKPAPSAKPAPFVPFPMSKTELEKAKRQHDEQIKL
ncbi:hypothetical protein D3C72_464070 [compost metagenome]